jgi:hypothetical protein
MGRPNLMAIFVNEPLCPEAKDGVRVPGKSRDMSIEGARAQTVVRVEKDQVFSGSLLETEVSGRRAAAIICA